MKKRRKHDDHNGQLLIDLLGEYFQWKKLNDATQSHYERSIRQFGQYLKHPPTLADLTDEICRGFLQHTVAIGFTSITANQRIKQIRAFWEWAARRRLVEAFPEFRGLPEPQPSPTMWAPDELEKLFAACGRQLGYIGPMPASLFWLTTHHLMLDTAEHAVVLLQLRWEWFNPRAQQLSIPAEVRKLAHPVIHPLSQRTCELLEEIRHPVRDLVFDCFFGVSAFYHRYMRLVKSAGLPAPRGKCGPEKMRATALQMIAEAGPGKWPPKDARRYSRAAKGGAA